MLQPSLRHDRGIGIAPGRGVGPAAVRRAGAMSPVGSDLTVLLDAEREATTALESLAGVVTAPEAQACLDELHYAMRWFCASLERYVRRSATRASSAPGVMTLTTERLMAAPTGVDRLRLLARTQRSLLARVESMLALSLAPDLRAFLEQARAVFAQSVHCCEDTIASLDREREVRL